MPSTAASGFARSGATSVSGRLASAPNSSCCSTLVTSWTMLTLRRVFLAILAVARMMIWETRNKGLYEGANFSHRDLILFFRHQLRVKIRYDRKRLDRTKGGCMQRAWSHERGQRWSHASLRFLCMVTMVRVIRDPTPGK